MPESEHNMHQDNPLALAHIIINDFLGEDNIVQAPEVQQEDFQNLAESEIITHQEEQ